MTIPRPMRVSLRGVAPAMRAAYFGTIGFGLLLMLVSIWAELLLALPPLALSLVAFVYTAPFVLGRRWRAPPPGPTRRPVVRRRRA